MFLPVSRYYLDYMPSYLGVPQSKMRVAPLGINVEGYFPRRRDRSDVFTVGYFARVAPEKGLHMLADAYQRFRARSPTRRARLVAAGYLAPEHEGYLNGVVQQIDSAGLRSEFEYRGELDRAGKIEFLQELDVMSVPATYDEPKGMFLLEAMAIGVPVVQPRRGAFPEIVETTGGGILVERDDPEALAAGLERLQNEPTLATTLGQAGAIGVRAHYTVGHMAETVEQIYRETIGRRQASAV
jgi:glycosyltransferase involved in cell wall biosynthesis